MREICDTSRHARSLSGNGSFRSGQQRSNAFPKSMKSHVSAKPLTNQSSPSRSSRREYDVSHPAWSACQCVSIM